MRLNHNAVRKIQKEIFILFIGLIQGRRNHQQQGMTIQIFFSSNENSGTISQLLQKYVELKILKMSEQIRRF